jgi:hypothetical protein
MAAPCPSAPVLLPNVIFDGNNFWEWSMMLRVCLGNKRLWGHLTGHNPRLSVLVHPTKPCSDTVINNNNNQTFYSQVSWGRLEMKPHETKKGYKTRAKKEKTKGNKKTKSKKEKKTIKR